jgi:hypothetical protein
VGGQALGLHRGEQDQRPQPEIGVIGEIQAFFSRMVGRVLPAPEFGTHDGK